MSNAVDQDAFDTAAFAQLDFQPVTDLAKEWTPPTNVEWVQLANPHLISVRLAWLTLQKTKDELIALSHELGDQALMELVGQIGRSADWFEGLHKLLASAECRIMCAYAALHADASNS
jgi:hypothetical protein